MDNTDLFRFEFTNRTAQQNIINSILEKRDSDYTIWIHGKSGVGKTYFIKHILEQAPIKQSIYIDLPAEEISPNCLLALISEMDKISSQNFIRFLKDNYMGLVNIAKNSVIFAFEKITDINISDIVDSLFDLTCTYVTKSKKQHNSITLLKEYINSILKEKDLLIVIDNFSYCDKKSISLILELIRFYSKQIDLGLHKVYFILCTSDDESTEGEFVRHKLLENIPIYPIEISPFDNFRYFYEIMFRIFDMSKISAKTIEDIFQFCKGYPQNLNDFIHRVYDKNGISFSAKSSKATIELEAINQVLLSPSCEVDISNLEYKMKLILLIIVEFGKTLSIELLIKIVNWIKKDNYLLFSITDDNISESIIKLCEMGVLSLQYKDLSPIIKVEHNLRFENIRAQLHLLPSLPFVNGNLFLFIINNESLLLEIYTVEEISELKAYHSYASKVSNWYSYNIDFMTIKYNLHQYEDAMEIADRLYEAKDIISDEIKLIMAECFFYGGKYISSQEILSSIDKTKLNTDYFHYYYLFALVENILLNKKDSLEYIDLAIEMAENDKERLIQGLNMKQRILSTTQSGRIEAKKIYDETKRKSELEKCTLVSYGKMLKSSIEFYRGQQAENDLNKAEEIALLHDNQLELGAIYTNRGFNDFWQGNIQEAIINFNKACDYLKDIRIQEVAYPLNNLAVCYLMEGNIKEALSCLQLATLWNRSSYVSITLRCQFMICYVLSGNKEYLPVLEELKQILTESAISDISIQIKLNYNIAFVYKNIGDETLYHRYKEKAFLIARAYNPKVLPYLWMKDYDSGIEEYINKHVGFKYAFFKNMRFEPWLVTLSHD